LISTLVGRLTRELGKEFEQQFIMKLTIKKIKSDFISYIYPLNIKMEEKFKQLEERLDQKDKEILSLTEKVNNLWKRVYESSWVKISNNTIEYLTPGYPGRVYYNEELDTVKEMKDIKIWWVDSCYERKVVHKCWKDVEILTLSPLTGDGNINSHTDQFDEAFSWMIDHFPSLKIVNHEYVNDIDNLLESLPLSKKKMEERNIEIFKI